MTSLIKSVFSPRFLYVQRCRLRELRAFRLRDVAIVRPLGFFVGGLLLAAFMLSSVAFVTRDEATIEARAVKTPIKTHSVPEIVLAADFDGGEATDGRAVADAADERPILRMASPVATRIDPACAAHAREKLMVGLTNYYLQRQLNPGAAPADGADTRSMTGLLTGPGDPVATTSEAFCLG